MTLNKLHYLLLLLICLTSVQKNSQCGQVMDLNTWTVNGGNSDWSVQPSGTSVIQGINGFPTYFVNDFDFINVEFNGRFVVTGSGDNDFVGFTFGYQGPFNPANNNDYYLFSVVKNEPAPHGTTCENFFGYVNGTTPQLDLWNYNATAPSTITNYLCDDTSFPGWNLDQVYDFTCRYTSTNVTIFINGVEIVNHDGCFQPGRFGFYNHSQNNVIYSDFSYTVISDFDIASDSLCLGESVDLTLFCDPTFISPYASTTWDMGDGTVYTNVNSVNHEYLAPGVYDVSLTIVDVNGCTDTRVKQVVVLDPVVDLGPDITHCENIQSNQDLTTTILIPDTYLWNTGETTPTINVNQSGTYAVLATNSIGCTAVDTIEVTFNPKPTANFTFNDTCFNEPNQMTDGSVSNADSITSWAWDFNADWTTDATIANPTHVFPNVGTHPVSLTVEDDLGCSDTVVQTLETFDLPVADFTVNEACLNDVTNFVNTSTIPSGNITDWAWDFGDGNTSNLENPSHTYAAENVYNVSLTVTSNQGCTHTTNGTSTVYPLPQVDFSNTTVCSYLSTDFTDQTVISNANTANNLSNWNWDFGDGNTSTLQNPTHQYAGPGLYNVNLDVESDHACSAAFSKTVTVLEQPVADFIFNDTCFNEPNQLTDVSVSNAASITSWAWDFNADWTTDATIANPTHVFPNVGTHPVSLIVENDLGCSDTVVQTLETFDLPVADFDVNEVCLNDVTNFVNTSTIPSGNITDWAWDFGDGNTSNLENPSHTYAAENKYNVSLTVTSNQGCMHTTNGTSTVYPLPQVDFSNTTVCSYLSTDFTDQTVISNANTANNLSNWNWDFGDGNTSTLQNPTHQYAGPGLYNVNLDVESDRVCSAAFSKTVTVLEQPVADFIFNDTCFNEPITFVDNSFTNSGALTNWAWDFDGDLIDDATGPQPTHVFPSVGTYSVRLIAGDNTGCADTVVQIVEIFDLPVADFSAGDVCLNDLTNFSNSSSIPSGSITAWSWDFGDGNTSNLENPTHTYSDEEVYDVTLTVTSNHGCTNTTTGTGTVYPLPQVSFSPTSVCLDSNTVFTDLSSISNDHTSNTLTDWAWDFGDGTSSTLQNPTHTYAGAGTYTAILTVTSNQGCDSTLTETVIVHPKLTADFSGMNLRGCSPFCAELNSNAVVANPSSVAQYSWTLSNGETHESNQSFFGPCFENNGGSTDFIDVQLTVTTNEGCQNILEIPNMIEVYHNPIADFYYAPDTPDVINPIVDFYNTSAFADHYEWSMNDAVLTTTNPEYEFPAEPGYHTIRLIAYTDEGCYDTTYNVVEILDKLIFYVPNTFTPDGNNFNDHFLPVFTSGYDAEDYNMVIFNRWGERIFETNEVHFGWNGRDIRTGQEAIPGTYIWKIEFRESMSDKRHNYSGHVNLIR